MYDPRANRLGELVGVGFILGVVAGLSVYCLLSGWPWDACVYVLSLEAYFLGEFMATYLWQSHNVTSRSFLIYGNRGNKEFWLMQLLTVWEYFLHRSRWGVWRGSPPLMKIFGMVMAIVGLAWRLVAMKQCGALFNHHLQSTKSEHLRLVTTGLYSIMRHPSYFGFWLFVIGSQAMLGNWLNMVVDIAVLARFFTVRLLYEEAYLIHRLYGDDYTRYKQNVGVWIPFVRT